MGIVARQSIKASIANYFGVILGFVNLFFLFPLFFNPTDLGGIRLMLELGVVFSSFALVGTNFSINRFFPYFKTDDQEHNGFFFWVLSFPVVGYTVVFFALVFFKIPLLSFFKADIHTINNLYVPLLFLIFFSMFQVVFETSNANHGRIAVPNFLREIVLRIIILSSGSLFYFKLISFTTCVWIIVGAYAFIAVSNLLYLKSLTKIRINPDFNFLKENPGVKKDALMFTAWLFLSSATSLIVNKIDFVMVSVSKSLADTAIYSTGFYLAMIIEIPKRTMLQISNPIVADLMKNQNYSAVQKMYKQLANNQLLAAAILFSLIWINIDSFFSLMPNGDFYKAGKTVVLIIGLGRMFDMIGSTTSPIMSNSRFYALGFVNSIISITVAILANYFLIPVLGINGAALATIITFFLSQGALILIIYLKMRIHPFETGQIKSVLILLIGLLFSLTGSWFGIAILDIAVKTICCSIILLGCVFYLNISPEFNSILSKLINQLKIRLKGR